MADLKQVAARLRDLGEQPVTPDARREVEQALQSKWEGIQAVAARTLARWGGRESVDALRGWLLHGYEKQRGWAIRGVAIEALTACYERQDIPWILDLFFASRSILTRYELLWPMMVSLPASAVSQRLRVESQSLERDRRAAAMLVIGSLREALPGRHELLQELANDEDARIRGGARTFLDGPQVPVKYSEWYFGSGAFRDWYCNVRRDVPDK